tara:strand:+ start:153 stop:1157 length:1005 start_codon:yes stop_codon:yes gene_type:complete
MKLYNYLEETYIKFLRTILIALVLISLLTAIIFFITGIYQFSGAGISKPKAINTDNSSISLNINSDISNVFENLPKTAAQLLEIQRKTDQERAELEKKRQELDKAKQLFDSKKQSEFRVQAEKIAIVARNFLELKKRDELITLPDLQKKIYEKIIGYNISVLCSPFYSNKETEVICANPLYSSSNTNAGKILKFDSVDLTTNSNAFFGKDINYFDLQMQVLNEMLNNDLIKTLFMEGKIDDPIFEALTLNHNNIKNAIRDYYRQGQDIIKAQGVQANMSDYLSAKAVSAIKGTKTLTISLGIFGGFVALMLLIVFYKIERHLKVVSDKKDNFTT